MNDPYSHENPWSAPAAKPPSPYNDFGPVARPQVVVWFYIYCGILTSIYLLLALGAVLALFLIPSDPAQMGGNAKPEDIFVFRIMGGIYFVLDHQANPGTDEAGIAKLHRIEKAQVIREVTAAGFKLVGEGKALNRGSDDHTKMSSDPAIRSHTDQFMLKFQKV